MTIREELKKLVAKLGGTPSKDDQTAELIHKVTDNVSGGGGGSSLIPVTLTAGLGGSITATISASEVMEGLANGTRYEVFYRDLYLLHDSEDGATPPFSVGELKLDTSGTEAFVWSTMGGSDGRQDRLSVLFIGINRGISGTDDLTWYANSTGYYLYFNSWD